MDTQQQTALALAAGETLPSAFQNRRLRRPDSIVRDRLETALIGTFIVGLLLDRKNAFSFAAGAVQSVKAPLLKAVGPEARTQWEQLLDKCSAYLRAQADSKPQIQVAPTVSMPLLPTVASAPRRRRSRFSITPKIRPRRLRSNFDAFIVNPAPSQSHD